MPLLTSLRAKLFPAAPQTDATSAPAPTRTDFAGMMTKASTGAPLVDSSGQMGAVAPAVMAEAKPGQDVAMALASRPDAIMVLAQETPNATSSQPVVPQEAAATSGKPVILPSVADEEGAKIDGTDDAVEDATSDAAATDDTTAPVPAPVPVMQLQAMPSGVQEVGQFPTIAGPVPVEHKPNPAVAIETEGAAIAQAGDREQPAKASKFEALSLLQIVRDHMTVRSPRAKESAAKDTVEATASDDTGASAAILSNLTQGGTAAPVATAAPQGTLAQSTATMPTVDLSASLGAQVVDMGVSGQWIDGLARDIAGLSANGAQGRFQINADHLGPIQVDIRQGTDGAAVSLTVATEVAELALRQDSDRLKLDAGLSAVRISEVKIERASHVAEAARADSTGNQNSSQQQGPSTGWQGQGQGMGQSSAQSHMQGRGQSRENIASDLKGSSDGVVLNHEQAADMSGDLPRARFA